MGLVGLACVAVVSGGGGARDRPDRRARQLRAEQLQGGGDAPVRVAAALGAPPGRVPLLNRAFQLALPTSKLGARPTLGVQAAVCPARGGDDARASS